jgi:hypothetical protein
VQRVVRHFVQRGMALQNGILACRDDGAQRSAGVLNSKQRARIDRGCSRKMQRTLGGRKRTVTTHAFPAHDTCLTANSFFQTAVGLWPRRPGEVEGVGLCQKMKTATFAISEPARYQTNKQIIV